MRVNSDHGWKLFCKEIRILDLSLSREFTHQNSKSFCLQLYFCYIIYTKLYKHRTLISKNRETTSDIDHQLS
jgi:hypothetical protein